MSGGAAVPEDMPVSIASGFRMQWEEAQGTHVLLYPEGMVKLSKSAFAILERCDGTSSVAEIIASLEEAFPGAELAADVREFLQIARDRGWITLG